MPPKIKRLWLTLSVLLFGFALAQQGLVFFPALSSDLNYPYLLYLRNEGLTPLTVSLDDITARLAPVTPDLGRVAHANLVFAPDVSATITLPPSGADTRVAFRLEPKAPPGVYALEPNLPGGSIWENPPGFDSVIDYPLAYTPGLRILEVYQPGQRFLSLGAARGYRYDGRPLGYREGYGRLFTLTGYRNGTAWFRVEGLTRPVTLRTASRSSFPGLAPLLHDPALPVLRRTYVRKQVWAYGGFELTCAYAPETRITFAGPPRTPLRVRRMFRVAWPINLSLASTEGGGGYNAASPGDLMVATPLVVQFETSGRLTFTSASGGGDLDGLIAGTSDASLLRRCPPLAEFVADAWQLPTILSLEPPPNLPRIRNVDDYLGLTRTQYTWLKGYPSATFGKQPRLLKLMRWKYANIPFPITVTFGRGGRVVAQDVPRLP